jgi:hypothetical protein
VNRATALAHLQTEFAAMAAVTGQATDDSAAGYGGALDQALRQLGFAAGDLATADVPDLTTPDYLHLAEYYALARFSRALALSVDVETDVATGKRSRSSLFDKVLKLLDKAGADLVNAGYLVGGGFEVGRMNLDFLEPSAGW